jgi:hypothetical protein
MNADFLFKITKESIIKMYLKRLEKLMSCTSFKELALHNYETIGMTQGVEAKLIEYSKEVSK